MDFSQDVYKRRQSHQNGRAGCHGRYYDEGSGSFRYRSQKGNGSINVKEEPLPPKKADEMAGSQRRLAFVDSLVTGTKTLMYSAGVVEERISRKRTVNRSRAGSKDGSVKNSVKKRCLIFSSMDRSS